MVHEKSILDYVHLTMVDNKSVMVSHIATKYVFSYPLDTKKNEQYITTTSAELRTEQFSYKILSWYNLN